MEINELTQIRKKVANVQEQDEKLIVLSNDNKKMIVLNETSKYLYENCDGKSILEIARALMVNCINQEELVIDNIIEDVGNAFLKMEEQGLIEFI